MIFLVKSTVRISEWADENSGDFDKGISHELPGALYADQPFRLWLVSMMARKRNDPSLNV